MPKEIFKITSAGSVDDGKSTILARLLLDTGSIYDDQLSKSFDPSRLADLLDGLESEREQGITIDVAHRFFDSQTRRYQIADSPGHEQYTRNMATACAGSDALLLVVDAQEGPKPQTFHHLEIALRLGIRKIVFAVNKMDTVGYSKQIFTSISDGLEAHLQVRKRLGGQFEFQVIPLSGLKGHNVVRRSSKLSWFSGPTLLEALDGLSSLEHEQAGTADVFQVQLVQRIPGGGRRYLGRELAGTIEKGTVFDSKIGSLEVKEVFRASTDQRRSQHESISIELSREIDLDRGALLASALMDSHDQYEVDLIWLSQTFGQKGHLYLLKAGPMTALASITKIHTLDLETNLKNGEAQRIETNHIVRANINLNSELELQPFSQSLTLGSFILISQATGQTVAVGTVNHALRRSENLTRHEFDVSPTNHSGLTGNIPRVYWFTGLSGSGKSTIANQLSGALFEEGMPHAVLDGDNLRLGINRDLGFKLEDRTENIRRTAEIANLMCDAGLIVLVSLVSPMEADREMARQIIGSDRFELVFVDTPIEVCEERDPKGLYRKAREGEIPNFTGINSPFEKPNNFNWKISTHQTESPTQIQNLLAHLLG